MGVGDELHARASHEAGRYGVNLAWRPAPREAEQRLGNLEAPHAGPGPRGLAALHARWRDAEASFAYYSRLWRSLQEKETISQTCAICLEDFNSAGTGTVLRCGHIYCTPCVDPTP